MVELKTDIWFYSEKLLVRKVKVFVAQLCPTLCDPMDYESIGLILLRNIVTCFCFQISECMYLAREKGGFCKLTCSFSFPSFYESLVLVLHPSFWRLLVHHARPGSKIKIQWACSLDSRNLVFSHSKQCLYYKNYCCLLNPSSLKMKLTEVQCGTCVLAKLWVSWKDKARTFHSTPLPPQHPVVTKSQLLFYSMPFLWSLFPLPSANVLPWVPAQWHLSLCSQAPLSTGFPRQEYWNRLPFPPPEDLCIPGI